VSGTGPGQAAVKRNETRRYATARTRASAAGSDLQLDDAQKARLGTLFDKLDEQRLALVGSTPDPRAELDALVAGTIFDRGKALTLVTEKTDALRSKGPEVIAAAADFYDSLSPDQQARVRAFMERRRHGRG